MALVWWTTNDSPNSPNFPPSKLSCYAVVMSDMDLVVVQIITKFPDYRVAWMWHLLRFWLPIHPLHLPLPSHCPAPIAWNSWKFSYVKKPIYGSYMLVVVRYFHYCSNLYINGQLCNINTTCMYIIMQICM